MSAPVLVRHDLRHPDGRSFTVYGDVVGTLQDQSADTGFDVGALHRRYDRLTDTWVLVSPARNKRPGGRIAGNATEECPLCPGGPELPWPYELAVFDNRFPSLAPDAPAPAGDMAHDARFAESGGRCQVVVYTSDHEGSMASLPPSQLLSVLAVWRERTGALWAEGFSYVMAFENRGAAVGATLRHPHGQLYALAHVPPSITYKRDAHDLHRSRSGTCLGCTLLDEDAGSGRILLQNDSFVAAVPFAPHWPYEVQIRAKRHGARRLIDLDDIELRDLAQMISGMLDRYDALFDMELPLMLCVQEAPPSAVEEGALDDWHLHIELLPPHRSAHQLKVRASVETTMGVFINDTLPEDSAARLAAIVVADKVWPQVPTIHAATLVRE
jgi:UDPglucose--hexose-1-phosphate uridylyltransferase